MPKREQKNFYAVSRGKIAPAITQCWAIAHEQVSGYSGNLCKVFETFDEAKAFLENEKCFTFHFLEGPTDGPKSKSNQGARRPTCYAVANGKKVGVYPDYITGAELQVKKYSHACHKSFATSDAAEAFMQARMQTNYLIPSTNTEATTPLGSNGTGEDELVARLDVVTLGRS